MRLSETATQAPRGMGHAGSRIEGGSQAWQSTAPSLPAPPHLRPYWRMRCRTASRPPHTAHTACGGMIGADVHKVKSLAGGHSMSAVPPLMPGVGAWAHPRRAMHNAGRGQRGLFYCCMQRSGFIAARRVLGCWTAHPGFMRALSPARCCPGGPPGAPPACREAACTAGIVKASLQGV